MTTTEETPMRTTFTPAADDENHAGRRLVLAPSENRPGDLLAITSNGAKGGASSRVAHAQVPALALAALTHGGWGPGEVEVNGDQLFVGDSFSATAAAYADNRPDDLRRKAAAYLALAAHIEAANAAPPPDPAVERIAEAMHDAYEAAAAGSGWETNPTSRKPWAEVPEANRRATRAATRVALDLAVRESGAPAPEPEQPAPVAVGDRVVVVASPHGSGHHGLAVSECRDAENLRQGFTHLVRPDTGRPIFPAVVRREADAAGENGAGA